MFLFIYYFFNNNNNFSLQYQYLRDNALNHVFIYLLFFLIITTKLLLTDIITGKVLLINKIFIIVMHTQDHFIFIKLTFKVFKYKQLKM